MIAKIWNILSGKKQFILAGLLAGWIAYCDSAGVDVSVKDFGCYIIAGLIGGNKVVKMIAPAPK